MKKILFLTIFMIFIDQQLLAVTYSYEDIVKKALNHNYQLKQIQEQIYQADLLISKSYTFLQPTLDMNARYTINNKESKISFPLPDGQGGVTNIDSIIQEKYTYSIGATVNYTLLNLRAFPLIRVARKMKDIQLYSKKVAVIELKYGIAQLYINILTLNELLEINKLSKKNLNAHLENVKTALKLKNAIEIEKLSTEVEIAKIETQIQQTLGTIKQLKSQLATMMGVDNYDFNLKPIDIKQNIISLDDAKKKAIKNRIENKITLKQIDIEKDMLENIYMQFYPSFFLQGTWNYNKTPMMGSEDHTSWNISIVMALPIWDGGVKFKDIKEEKSKIASLKLKMREFNDNVKQEIKSILIDIENIDLTLKRIEKEETLAKKNLELTQTSYKLGVAKNIDIIDATHALHITRLSATTEKLKKTLNLLKLKKIIGKL